MSIAEGFFVVGRLLGLPFGALWFRSWVRRRLREQKRPLAIQDGAAHVVACLALWTFVLSHVISGQRPAGVDILGTLLLVVITPVLSAVNLIRVSLVPPSRLKPWLLILFGLHCAGVGIFFYAGQK